MNQSVLTVIDTTSIQNYIFGSNELRENVGASELVEQVTKDWVFETLCSRWRVNAAQDAGGRWQINDSPTLESGELDAEYSGPLVKHTRSANYPCVELSRVPGNA